MSSILRAYERLAPSFPAGERRAERRRSVERLGGDGGPRHDGTVWAVALLSAEAIAIGTSSALFPGALEACALVVSLSAIIAMVAVRARGWTGVMAFGRALAVILVVPLALLASDPSAESRAYILLPVAEAALERGDTSTAERLFAEAAQRAPLLAGAHGGLGRARLRSGRAALALDPLRRAVALDPRQVEAQVRLGEALHATGAPEEAVEHLRTAVGLQETVDGLRLLGRALEDCGRFDGALVAYTRAVQIAPDDAAAQRALGFAYLGRSLRLYAEGLRSGVADARGAEVRALGARAQPHLDTAARLQPDEAWDQLSRGLRAHLAGDDAAAITSLRTALQTQPDLPLAHETAADSLQRLASGQAGNDARRLVEEAFMHRALAQRRTPSAGLPADITKNYGRSGGRAAR